MTMSLEVVFVGCLQCVDDDEDLVEVSAHVEWVNEAVSYHGFEIRYWAAKLESGWLW